MKAHPDFSADILQVLFDELQHLRQAAHGKPLMEIDEKLI